MDYKELLNKRKKYVFDCVKSYYDEPLLITRGKREFLYDCNGEQYLDFYSGVATASFGYSDDEMSEKVKEQLEDIQYLPPIYLGEKMINLAEKISKLVGEDYKVAFTNSGSESIEHAILFSKLLKPNGEIVTFDDSFHGMALYSNSLTNIPKWKNFESDRVNNKTICTPYCYRCQCNKTEATCNYECIAEAEEVISSIPKEKFIGVLLEPILGVGGVITPPRDYYKKLNEIVRKYNGIIIFDEVQTGIGKTGEVFAFEYYGVQPDIICLGKGLGNGLPIGAVVAKESIAKKSKDIAYYSTFSGNPIACTVSSIVLDRVSNREWLNRIVTVGEQLLEGLNERSNYEFIGDVRGVGLLLAVEIVDDKISNNPNIELTSKIQNELKKRGILVGVGGVYGNVIRIAPPFITKQNDIEMFLNQWELVMELLNQ